MVYWNFPDHDLRLAVAMAKGLGFPAGSLNSFEFIKA
jgi:hypothetical protein